MTYWGDARLEDGIQDFSLHAEPLGQCWACEDVADVDVGGSLRSFLEGSVTVNHAQLLIVLAHQESGKGRVAPIHASVSISQHFFLCS